MAGKVYTSILKMYKAWDEEPIADQWFTITTRTGNKISKIRMKVVSITASGADITGLEENNQYNQLVTITRNQFVSAQADAAMAGRYDESLEIQDLVWKDMLPEKQRLYL